MIPFPRTKRSLENPQSSLSDPAEWLVHLVGGGETASKVHVNARSVMSYPPVYAGVKRISDDMAQMPLSIHRETAIGSEKATDLPVYGVFHNSPNIKMTSHVWRATVQTDVFLWGDGFTYVVRNRLGTPVALRWLPAAQTWAEEIDNDFFFVTLINGKHHVLRPEDVIHIPGFFFDGLMGSSLMLQKEAIGVGMAAQKFGATFFGNGASLGGILKHPRTLGTDGRAKLKEQWDKLKGSGYQGTAVLEEDMEYQRIGIPPEEAQFLETRKFSVSDVARILNIPPHMIGDLEKATFSNIAEQSTEYLRYTISPWVDKWEQELNRKIFPKDNKHYFKFNTGALNRLTQKERYESYEIGIRAGFMLRSEPRELEDWNRVDGLDQPLIPLNMTTPAQAEALIQEKITNHKATVSRIAQDFENYHQALVKRAINKHGADENLVTNEVAERVIADTGRLIEQNIAPLATDARKSELTFRFTDWIIKRLHKNPNLLKSAEVEEFILSILEGGQHD